MTHYLLFLRVEHVHINNWWAIFCPSVECVDFIKQTVETQDSCLSYTHIWQLLHVHKPHLALLCMQMTSALLFWSAVMHVKSIITRAAVRWDFVARQRRMNQVQLPLQTVDMEQNISQCFQPVSVFKEQASHSGGGTVSELPLPQTAAVAGAVGWCFPLAPAVRWSPHCVVWPWPAPVWPGSSPLPLGLVSPDPDVTNYGWGVSGELEWVETDVWMEKKLCWISSSVMLLAVLGFRFST